MSLVARNLTRTFKQHVAVADATLTLPPGRITGLVGPNGAGKTTLLLMLAGLLRPSSGTLELDGAPIVPEDLRTRVGWMPDVFGTWDSLTPTEILTTFAKLYGMPTGAATARARELLERVHLAEFADRPAQVLSRGQKQRLGFARAMVHSPPILLLDEPASGMDPRSRFELRDSLRALADGGCAVLVSSHILSELGEMVDDVVMMARGRTEPPPENTRSTWRIRQLGEPAGAGTFLTFDTEADAAAHLAQQIAGGVHVVEFARATNALEDSYFALEADRT
ncbi:ABC transporter related protein OS=Tsukamurella paurometabola (strain ATCC 8368 / DSM / CCUG 35730 / CIP 100753 / JCM 10117 / KCTC 9821 / NBRC 16120 / NCIMB 702349 / NCTC 13040) OX=521096 GN=Tpau_3735 PE=4 SV=1 [Tsukamurella paurometabola]|uniref:ABC transporter related protein n=1 Tax=Tsukamurella paurometabola (strain ATCC 8368 / DSM 20162 / CCUG 35730 / CIP 100753 / JCM 10117 / KCTC 9821 / NBRC 16120 / NCIMB 702349 / NCTC 13040) TaxID=521096 RepID=D5UYL0_TSUPD|nr:ABC transporter ATP-binding protein [Tsukamurella paurometabola]ADG80313.1 ABC transporter related protein [Tsukamurella paurometabola DSM 20162]SUP39221.1 Daunorubicin/doxorubicin resistance ATP-binding protein DrrA [Tsukamurella paurometabola]